MRARTLPRLVAPLCKSQMRAGHPSSSISFQGQSCSIPVCYKDGVSKRLCTVVAKERRRVQQDLRSETGFLLLLLPRVKWQSSPLPLNQPSWGRGLSGLPRSPPPPSFLPQGLHLGVRDWAWLPSCLTKHWSEKNGEQDVEVRGTPSTSIQGGWGRSDSHAPLLC